MTPEQEARESIDQLLIAAGWHTCDADKANIHAACGVAIREFPLAKGHGFADYLLYVDGKAVGVIEAKKEGESPPISGLLAMRKELASLLGRSIDLVTPAILQNPFRQKAIMRDLEDLYAA